MLSSFSFSLADLEYKQLQLAFANSTTYPVLVAVGDGGSRCVDQIEKQMVYTEKNPKKNTRQISEHSDAKSI
jgi:hypothetical protein